jgi:hypothetical protein
MESPRHRPGFPESRNLNIGSRILTHTDSATMPLGILHLGNLSNILLYNLSTALRATLGVRPSHPKRLAHFLLNKGLALIPNDSGLPKSRDLSTDNRFSTHRSGYNATKASCCSSTILTPYFSAILAQHSDASLAERPNHPKRRV